MALFFAQNSNLLAPLNAVNPNSDRSTDVIGGYKLLGNIVFVNLQFTCNYDVSSIGSDTALITSLPHARMISPLSCYNATRGTIISARVGASGMINFGGIAGAGDIIYVSGCYIIAG